MSDQSLKSPGITFLSVTVSCLSLLLLAILIQFFEIIEGSFAIDEISFARNALAVPAILIFLLLLAVGGLYQLAARSRLISRPEALCILFCLLIAAPIMSVGFWGQFIGTMGTIPRSGEFEKMAAPPRSTLAPWRKPVGWRVGRSRGVRYPDPRRRALGRGGV